MKKNKIIKSMMDFYRGKKTIDGKLLWTVCPLFVIIALYNAFATLINKHTVTAMLCALVCAIFPILVLLADYFYNKPRECYVLFCVVEGAVLVPITFVTNGGINSGMPIYCAGVATLCAFCSNRVERFLSFFATLTISTALFIFSLYHPEMIYAIRSEKVGMDITLSYIFVSLALVIIVGAVVDESRKHRYKEVNDGLLYSLSTIIEFRNIETGVHVRNIRMLTKILLETSNELFDDINFSRDEIEIISAASVLHDIGKIAVPDSILNKPGKLNDEERMLINQHPIDGCKMIESMSDIQDNEFYNYSYEICRHHHENYDGSGYPDGLKGENIPFVSQVVALADVFDALHSKRPYKEPFDFEMIYEIITAGCPGKFSERILMCYEAARSSMEQCIR